MGELDGLKLYVLLLEEMENGTLVSITGWKRLKYQEN